MIAEKESRKEKYEHAEYGVELLVEKRSGVEVKCKVGEESAMEDCGVAVYEKTIEIHRHEST
jgi:hypothetical protein